MNNHSPITIIVAALIIAGSMAVLFRWHVISSSIGLQRLDRWTGEIVGCTPVMDLSDAEKLHVGVQYRCKEMTAEELKQVKVDPSIR
jgi:hypothetical protein